jgi:hypothetical protein
MRVGIFLLILFAVDGAAGAAAECNRYVSAAGGGRTVLQFRPDPDRADFTLSDKAGEHYWQFSGSLGTGLEGTLYSLRGKPGAKPLVLYSSSLVLDHNNDPPEERDMLIFADMVFWPDCK